MEIPSSFKNALDRQDAEEKREQFLEMKENEKIDKREKLFMQKEEARIGEKIEICRKLFAWKDRFLENEEGARIFNKSKRHLWVFGGSWAHKHDEGGYGRWARIYFNPEDIEYWAGYKYMPVGPTLIFTKPEEMAKLNYRFLRKFLTEIENKKIFDGILQLNSP